MNKILKDVAYVFGANVFGKVITASSTFVIARLLSPGEYGTWITLMLIVSYAPIVALGTVEALVKQYPFYVGQGNLPLAARIEEGVFGAVVISSLTLLAGGLVVSRLWSGHPSSLPLGLVWIMVVTGSVAFVSGFFYYRFAAHQQFQLMSIVDTARAAITGLCLIAFTWLWGLSGTALGLLAAEVPICVASAWLCSTKCGAVRPSFDPSLMWQMVKIGLPITIIWWVFIIQSSVDRLISIWMLGDAATGFYGLGISIVTLIVLIPTTLSRVLYPQVNRKVGECDRRDIRRLVVVPSHALSIVLPAAIGLLVVTAPVLYKQVLPKYAPGLLSAQILLMGSFFACIVRTGANFLIAIERQRLVLIYVGLSLVTNVCANVLLARAGLGIQGIALGSFLSAFVLATLVWLAVFREMGDRQPSAYKDLGSLYLPYCLMVGALALVASTRPDGLSATREQMLFNGATFVVTFSVAMYSVPIVRSRSRELLGIVKGAFGKTRSVTYSADVA